MAKLGQGMARLAVWRKRAAPADHAAAEPGFVAEADTSPAPDSPPAPAMDSNSATVAVTPSPAIVDDALADGLAELGDPVSAPIDSVDIVFADGLAELDDLSAPMQNEVIPAATLDTDAPTDGLAGLDALSDPGPLEPDQAPTVLDDPLPADTPAPVAAAATEAATPLPARDEAGAPSDSGMRRPMAGLRRLAGRIRQFRLKGAGPVLIGLVGKKRVWIPGVSLALLGVVGSLAFMLLQSSSEKAQLQADLNAAKQALKQADARPAVAVIPPLLAGPVPPAEARSADPAPAQAAESPAPPAPPAEAASAQPAPEPVYLARAPSRRAPVQMDCDLSDKASVSLNLRKCIEAFNQATAR